MFDTTRTVGGIKARLRSLGLLSYAAFLRERKRSWKKLYLALPLDLPPRRNDPGVTGRGAAAAIKGAIEGVISDLAFELEQDRSKGSGPRF